MTLYSKVVPTTAQDDELAQSSSVAQPEFVDGCEVFSPECFSQPNGDGNGENVAENGAEAIQHDPRLQSDDEEAPSALGRRGVHRSLEGASKEAERYKSNGDVEEHEEFRDERHYLPNMMGLVSSHGLPARTLIAHSSGQNVLRKRKLNATGLHSSTKQTIGQSAWLDESAGPSGMDMSGELLEYSSTRKLLESKRELGRLAYKLIVLGQLSSDGNRSHNCESEKTPCNSK